jgi:hypothetical protein
MDDKGEVMICAGCRRELEVGDQYIKDTASGFTGGGNSAFDGLISEIMGGTGGEIFFCEDCTTTTSDGKYLFETVYGDEGADV